MPNGRRGDKPLSDILWYDLPTYDQETDALIREVDQRDADALADPVVQELIFEASTNDEARTQLVERLRHLRDREPR